MFQIEHRQGVEPVFAFNICCIALNASLCSSLEHVLAFKMCSVKNIILNTSSVQHLNTYYVFKCCTLEVFNITEHVQGVQYLLHCWCSNCVLYLNTLVQREIAKIWSNCSNFEESMRFGTHVVLTSTKRFSYSAKLILLFNGYFWGKILLFWRKIARNWKNATIYLFVD